MSDAIEVEECMIGRCEREPTTKVIVNPQIEAAIPGEENFVLAQDFEIAICGLHEDRIRQGDFPDSYSLGYVEGGSGG